MTEPMTTPTWDEVVTLGRFGKTHGLDGKIRLFVYSDEPRTLAKYERLWVGSAPSTRGAKLKAIKLLSPKWVPKEGGLGYLLTRIDGVSTVESAQAYTSLFLYLETTLLPPLDTSEGYYQYQLVGLEAYQNGAHLGKVEGFFSNTGLLIMQIKQGQREHLIPFQLGITVQSVDLKAGTLEISWDIA